MNIKRYSESVKADNYGMVEDTDGDYYSRADLIAAGCLVPVPDGEACDWEMLEDSDKDGLFVVDAQLCCRDRGTMNKVVNVSTGAATHIYDEDAVQPVRLARLEDVG